MSKKFGWRVLSGLSLAIPLALFGSSSSHAATSPYSNDFALSQNADQHVIVLFKNQHADLEGRANMSARAAAIHADQAPVLNQMSQAGAHRVTPFHVVNAISATVSAAEKANLQANASVQTVVPDLVVPQPQAPVDSQAGAKPGSGGTTVSGTLANACGSSPATAIQNEALSLTNDLQATQLTAPDGTKINGAGVKVAYIADSIDPHNVDFFRNGDPNQPVITDYQDFNGDGAYTSEGEEAAGDAAMIAAQGNQAYDVSQAGATASSTAPPCYVKVQGMAPGASIMALKVFGAEPAYSGIFIRAIEYAVDNGANVLNESFGGNPYPNFGNDPISLADAAAVADGVTVTTSSGDAGTTETLGSPSTLQDVIETGATTDLRSEQQAGYPGTSLGTGWLSNEISPFSSGGISQNGQRTIDVVAPGNSDWASCTGCSTGFGGSATGVVAFGGTSESSPITAGEAALVIQAYRSTHSGQNPSPAQVKQIIKSTSTSLDYPSSIQGAGLLNASKAVQAALSLPDSNGTPKPQGDTVLYSAHAGTSDPASTLFAAGTPGSQTNFSVQATNTGAHTAVVQPQIQTLGNLTNTNYALDFHLSNSNTFQVADVLGRFAWGENQTFTVPSGKDYLGIQFSWPNVIPNNGSRIRMTLYDPSGREAIYSRPQGTGQGWGNVEIHDPQAGQWTATFWEVGSGFQGTVNMTEQLGNMVSAGSVSPASRSLQPGQTATFNVNTNLPATAGDQSDNIVMTSSVSGTKQSSVIPVALRSYLNPGSFSGIITGGNGRPGAPGDTKAYNFNVPNGTKDISLGISLADSNYNLEGVLVDPAGNPVDVQSTVTTQDSSYRITGLTNKMQFFWANPQPGRWTYIQFVNGQASGAQTQEPFTGNLQFNGVQVSVTGMPTTPQAQGSTFTAHVTIKNTGNMPENFFVDPRKTTQTTYTVCCYLGQYPNPYMGFLVPTDTTQASVWSESLTGDRYDTELQGGNGQAPYGGTGIPDVMGTSDFNPVLNGGQGRYESNASYGNGVGSTVPAGFYYDYATLVGPWSGSSTGDKSARFAFAPQYTTKAFDSSVCPSNGDFWNDYTNTGANCGTNYSQVTVQPGQSTTIDVTFTVPTTTAKSVTGELDADTMNLSYQDPSNTVLSTGDGDVLAQLQYSYPVAS